ALAEWQRRLQANRATITGLLITETAQQLWPILYPGREQPKFSSGWLDGFKRRHGLSKTKNYGEAASISLDEDTIHILHNLQEEIKEFDLNDVYNMDETGLYWKMIPDSTLATEQLSSKK